MDRQKVQKIRMSLAEAIAGVGGEYDINIKVGNISFNNSGFTAKVIGEETDNNGMSKKVIEDWQMAVKLELVENHWFNKIFLKTVHDIGRNVKVIGYDFKKRKYPLIVQTVKGNVKYKMSVRDFKHFYKEAV